METYELERYAAEIAAAHPGLELAVTRVPTARVPELLADASAAASFDVVFGTALSALESPPALAPLAPHETSAGARLEARFVHRGGLWFCPSAYSIALCTAPARVRRLGAAEPLEWESLAAPAFRGELVLPHPGSSGAAYLQVAAILQTYGEQDGWDLLAALHANVLRYTVSGVEPCHAVARGECAVGVSVAIAVNHLIREGAPVALAVPTHAAGCEPEAFALLRGARDPAAARCALEWTLSAPARDAYVGYGKVPLAGGGAHAGPKVFAIDVARAAALRKETIARWMDRFTSDRPRPS
jgi:iron(III) transport system substrate-binding protein